MARRRVLILTYYWPPAGGPGVQRFLKFSRYLRDFDWEPIIITPRNGSYPYIDPSLEEDIPEGIQVVKTGTREPFAMYNRLTGKKGKSVSVGMTGFRDSSNPIQRLAKYVRANWFVPDARVGWKGYAVAAAHKLIESSKIDAVITTGPPHSTHLAGIDLQKKFSLPWLADFRDPWTTVYYNAFFPRTARTQRRDRTMEDSVLRSADRVVVISQGMKREFEDRARQPEVIYNGFDEDDLFQGVAEKAEHFHLCYIGNMKPNQQVPAIWKAAAGLAEEDDGFRRDFRFHFTGNLDASISEAIRAAGLGENLVVDGFVDHREATRRMFQAGMLLFVIPNAKDNDRIITGKIFEYLASNSRLFSVGPPGGDADRILQEAGRPAMMDYHQGEAMKAALKQGYADWKAGGMLPLKEPSGNFLRFGRKALTGQLAAQLDAISTADKKSLPA